MSAASAASRRRVVHRRAVLPEALPPAVVSNAKGRLKGGPHNAKRRLKAASTRPWRRSDSVSGWRLVAGNAPVPPTTNHQPLSAPLRRVLHVLVEPGNRQLPRLVRRRLVVARRGSVVVEAVAGARIDVPFVRHARGLQRRLVR